jgi:hypothetical protein
LVADADDLAEVVDVMEPAGVSAECPKLCLQVAALPAVVEIRAVCSQEDLAEIIDPAGLAGAVPLAPTVQIDHRVGLCPDGRADELRR